MTTTTGSRHTWTAQNHLFGEIRTPPNINGISWNIDDKTWPYNDYRLDGSYQQCYLALNKWRPYLTYLGIFPITNIFTKDASKKVIQSILLDASKLIWTLITTCIIAATIYLGFFENALRIPSVSESNAMMGFVVVIGVSAFINLITMTVQARHWPLFFRRCEVVDGILGIDCDSQLVSYVRRLVRTYVAFMTLCLGITMAVMYLKVIHGHFPGDLYPVYVILLNTHVLPCIFVPEIMFLFVCIVTSTRLKRLCQQLRRLMMATLMSSTSSYVRYDPLQKLRIAYQLVMIAIQHANHILGPVLIVSCLTNIYCPIVCVYLYVRNITQYGMDIMRVFLTILPVCRIIPICFFAHTAHQDARNVARILYKASTVRLTENTTQEVEFFIECSHMCRPAFSASGFFDVDRGFLTAIIGILLTYTVTILQLETGTTAMNGLMNNTLTNLTNTTSSTLQLNSDFLMMNDTDSISNFTLSTINMFN